MPHLMFRSAATALLAFAPVAAAAPAQAASQHVFPCAVGVQNVSNATTSTISVSVTCAQTRTVDVRITAGGTELMSLQQTVQAGVQQSVTVTVPRVQQACATLRTDGESTTLCTP
ncbi:hypothetical protein [Streptomyces sp.]|uniref:hypothetical protein n=1 Tax=Streptomyces sp. TaxID=1931 RepID=UPI002D6CD87A|nr:hypothetical protein [Streptomyces sp.]HZF89968.1 hypothetical protein [Streptomyces sp.]